MMITHMDPSTYKAATKGEIEIFKEMMSSQHQHLGLLLTPNKNTIIHINIAAQTGGPAEFSTNFVEQVLHLCPPLLLQVNSKGETALHIAARHGHDAAVKLLLHFAKAGGASGGDLDELESGGIQGEVDDHVKRLLVFLRMKNNKNDTALHEAARYNHVGVVQLLTQEDPDFSYSPNDAGETPVYVAAEGGYHEVAFEILRTCTSVDHRGPNGRTTLHAAIILKDDEMARKMLEANRSLTNEVDEQGWTPLHYAADMGDATAAKRLLDSDKSAAYIAVDKGGKKTALHVAAGGGHIEVMKEILSSCPDCFEMVDNRGWNVLHFAVDGGSDDGMKLVLENPLLCNLINEKDGEGNTALHYAAGDASMACIISSLIHNPKVDVMACNKQNLSALDIVLANHHSLEMKESIVHHLKTVGSRPAVGQVVTTANDFNPKEGNSEITAVDGGNTTVNSKSTGGDDDEDAKEVNLIVATLIATVTFAAAFTMPGGYIESGRDEGGALLTRNTAFQAFVITDTIAMMLSSSSVLLRLSMATNKNLTSKKKLLLVESYLTTTALFAMVVAYSTGTYAVLSHSRSLAVATCVLGSSVSSYFIFVYYVFSKGW